MRKRHGETRAAGALDEREDDDALDRLVSDEIDAILESVDVLGERAKRARRARRPAASRDDDVVHHYPFRERVEEGEWPKPRGARPTTGRREEHDDQGLAPPNRPKARRERTTGDPPSGPAEVIGLSARRPMSEDSLFSSEEDAFLSRTIAWLRPRPNADLLLEEIWRAAIEADAPSDDLDMAAEFPSTDDEPLAHFGAGYGDIYDLGAVEDDADDETPDDAEDRDGIDDDIFDDGGDGDGERHDRGPARRGDPSSKRP